MKNIVKSNNYNQNTPGLNGFFGWLRRTVNNVLNAVAEVSHNPFFALSILQDAFDGDGQFNLGNDNPGEYFFRGIDNQEVELTLQEEAFLDSWVEQKFKPLFLSYFSQLKQFSLNNPTLNDFKQFYNNAHEFIGYINWSINNVTSHNSQPFISDNAITARNRFLVIQMELLEADIMSFIEASNFDFSVGMVQQSLQTSKYHILDFNVNASVIFQRKKFIENSFVGTTTNYPVNNGTGITTSIPINDETVITYNNPKPTKSENGRNGIKIALMFGMGLLLSKLLSSNSKETVE